MRSVGGAALSSRELGDMLCSVSCRGVVISMSVLQAVISCGKDFML
mgnify:CR=1 FL=1